MADCAYYEELIGAGLDGELTEAEAAALRAHLENCESCRAFSDALRGISESLREDLPTPPADLTDRIMASVRAQAAPKKTKIVPLRLTRYAALAAVLAVAVLAGVRLGGLGMRKGAPQAVSAEAPMMAMSAAAPAEAAEDAGEPPAPEARAETAANGAASAVTGSVAAAAAPEILMDSMESAPEDAEAPFFDAPAAAAMPAARAEYRLYRGESEELLASGADGGELLSLLVVDKPGPVPDRTPDYVLEITGPDGAERSLALWEEDGAILLREAEGNCGFALSAERFREIFGIG